MPALHIKSIPVEAEAIDVHRHVNNQEYLRWMQEIAIEHSALQGWSMDRYLASSASWYVKSHFIDYLYPAVLGDTLLACTWVAEMSERRSRRCTLFLRAKDHQPIARAETQWIFVSLKNGRPLAIPDELRAAFEVVATEEAAQEAIARQLTQTAAARPEDQ